jgi:hypothetical protein
MRAAPPRGEPPRRDSRAWRVQAEYDGWLRDFARAVEMDGDSQRSFARANSYKARLRCGLRGVCYCACAARRGAAR